MFLIIIILLLKGVKIAKIIIEVSVTAIAAAISATAKEKKNISIKYPNNPNHTMQGWKEDDVNTRTSVRSLS